jgi:L-fuconolactonase
MIDAHQHFWQLGRHGCAWPTPDLARIHRDFLPADLRPLLLDAEVRGSVAVQSQPNAIDTDYLCRLADETEWVRAVVGWVDMASPAAPARIAELAQRPKLRGLRPMFQDMEPDALTDPALEPALSAMLAHQLSFDALVRPRHLRSLHRLATTHQDLRVVIDHAAKPDIAHGILDPWRADMRALASLPNVFCKLSGLVTEARTNWQTIDLEPFVTHLLEHFGPQRLMWGSDWPVVKLTADYSTWARTARELTRKLSPADSAALFDETATRFYRL